MSKVWLVAVTGIALLSVAPQPSPPKYGKIVEISYRNPIGHTHTCTNGHTWDHTLCTGHHCPYCGAEPPKNSCGQWLCDVPARMVMIRKVRKIGPGDI